VDFDVAAGFDPANAAVDFDVVPGFDPANVAVDLSVAVVCTFSALALPRWPTSETVLWKWPPWADFWPNLPASDAVRVSAFRRPRVTLSPKMLKMVFGVSSTLAGICGSDDAANFFRT
jgi:hypothetical protein